MNVRTIRLALFAGSFLVSATAAQAQTIAADLKPAIDSPRVHAGQAVKARLTVHLPQNLVVPSDKPGSRFMVATLLTIEAPAGVTVSGITYPRSHQTLLAGQKKPTLAIGPDFTILVQFRLAPTAAGNLSVPARLRYQACNASTCYPPATVSTQWTLHLAGGHD